MKRVLHSWLWPIAAMVQARHHVITNGRRIEAEHGVPMLRQWLRQSWLSFRYNLGPDAYYQYRFFDPATSVDPVQIVQHREVVTLFPRLNAARDGSVLGDKVAFFRRCRDHSLPTVPVIAAFSAGALSWLDGGSETLPDCDLFLKPRDSFGGKGARAYAYSPPGRWVTGEVAHDEASLLADLASASLRRDVLLQPRIVNSREVRPVAGRGLATFRVVTYRCSVTHEVETLYAFLRMPVGEAIVDNLGAGGLAAPIDLETGILQAASSKGLDERLHRVHPDSGAQIEGRKIDAWPDVKQLCTAAHGAFPEKPFVGWDVAPSADGPLLVEGNGTFWVQLPGCDPLGSPRFPSLYVREWERMPAVDPESAAEGALASSGHHREVAGVGGAPRRS